MECMGVYKFFGKAHLNLVYTGCKNNMWENMGHFLAQYLNNR